MIPRFSPGTSKAIEAVLWLAAECPAIDVYHVVKACFYADKEHLTLYGRPIYGENYEAAPYGPLAKTVYGLLRGDPIAMLAIGGNGDAPFKLDHRYRVVATRGPNMRKLSASDVDALQSGLNHVRIKNFDDLFRETHLDPAYVNAEGLAMDARAFLPADLEDREAKAQDIFESAEYTAF